MKSMLRALVLQEITAWVLALWEVQVGRNVAACRWTSPVSAVYVE